ASLTALSHQGRTQPGWGRAASWATALTSQRTPNAGATCFALALVRREAYGVRRQSAAATALWISSRRLWKRRPHACQVARIQSGGALRFPPQSKTLALWLGATSRRISRGPLAFCKVPKAGADVKPRWATPFFGARDQSVGRASRLPCKRASASASGRANSP